MTQKQIRKIPDPNPEWIIRCEQCTNFVKSTHGSVADFCSKKNNVVLLPKTIPNWCPLSDWVPAPQSGHPIRDNVSMGVEDYKQ